MLDIVIVNYNTGDLLRQCLASLAALPEPELISRVIVVDNHSGDGSLEQALPALPGALCVRNADNRGFAAACNQGAALGSAPWLLFLNPDTRLEGDTLPVALQAFARHPATGIVGVPLLDEQGRVSVSCSRLPRLRGFLFKALGLEGWAARRGWSQPMREWAHDETRVVEQVMGAFFLLPRPLFDQLGGFDERYFVYFEEVDLCARARRAGRHCLFVAETRAWHVGCGSSSRLKAHRLFYSLRSRLLYGARHFAPLQAWTLLPLTLVLEPLARGLQLLLRRDGAGLRALLQGSVWLWRDLPHWWPRWRDMRREQRQEQP